MLSYFLCIHCFIQVFYTLHTTYVEYRKRALDSEDERENLLIKHFSTLTKWEYLFL